MLNNLINDNKIESFEWNYKINNVSSNDITTWNNVIIDNNNINDDTIWQFCIKKKSIMYRKKWFFIFFEIFVKNLALYDLKNSYLIIINFFFHRDLRMSIVLSVFFIDICRLFRSWSFARIVIETNCENV